MKVRNSIFASIMTALLLVGCSDTEGLSAESTKPIRGNPSAAVRLTEYADLQCPACRSAHAEILTPLLDQYSSSVAFEFKHFPLRSIHRYALEAALASECAADQGKFWEYIDHVYENQSDMTMDALTDWARQVGVSDMELFEKCQKSQIKKDTVNDDYKSGRDLGVSGTPSFFVNGERVTSNPQSIREALDAAISRNSQPL